MGSQQRIQQDIATLREISDPAEAGTTRIGFTASYRLGVDYIKRRMQEAGLQVREDAIGNVYGLLPGEDSTLPPIISGSHLDTVRCAGAFDGIAGVVCALEVARLLQQRNVKLKHPFEVLALNEEEGGRSGRVLLGSQFITGRLTEEDLDTLVDHQGVTLRAIRDEYQQGQQVVPVCRQGEKIKAFIELHDEQGPLLEATSTAIGIVENVVAIAWLTVTVTGFAGHAGTVPMLLRQDAGVTACEIVSRLHQYVIQHHSSQAVATIGKFELQPGSTNCIPAKCQFTVDIRAADEGVVQDLIDYLQRTADQVSEQFNTAVTITQEVMRPSVQLDPLLQNAIEQSCQKLGFSYRRMSSGAGHDAMIFADICRSAMLFVPCEKGITHHPAEYVSGADLVRGTAVLYETILAVDQLVEDESA